MSKLHRSMVQSTGRIAQKAKTRNQLLIAARELMAEQSVVTVATVAERAGISTATAYRYFPNPETIQLEAVTSQDIGAQADFIQHFQSNCTEDLSVIDRVNLANRIVIDFVMRNEAGYRLFIAKTQEKLASAANSDVSAIPYAARRLALIRLAMDPLRKKLGTSFYQACDMVFVASGPEVYFMLRDTCRNSAQDAARSMENNLRAIISSF
ncbi:TetR/AcrR family transcriptional regulator [Marivivens sp.]|nr:TetR/AcrR family transcriptional regulator [Marivivens sp.]MCL7405801.1 TetR/AcrR family transcriptional regulator [Marivivens geojensis]